MQRIIFVLLCVIAAIPGFSQSKLVLNGAFVTLSNDVYVVVDNSATSAILRNSGHIISEGENNRLKWNLGTTTGTFTVPFGYGTTDYLPVTFTKAAGTGSGAFV